MCDVLMIYCPLCNGALAPKIFARECLSHSLPHRHIEMCERERGRERVQRDCECLRNETKGDSSIKAPKGFHSGINKLCMDPKLQFDPMDEYH